MSKLAERRAEERRVEEAKEEMQRLGRMVQGKGANISRRLYQVRVVQGVLESLAAHYKLRDRDLQDPAY